MQRLSIARSLRLALIGLTIVLAVVAGLGVSSLYSSRQRYEDTLLRTSALSVAAANLASAGIAQEEVLRDTDAANAATHARGRSPRTATARAAAARAFDTAAARAASLASDDPASERLIGVQRAAETQARELTRAGAFALAGAPGGPLARARSAATQLQALQQTRAAQARALARSDSRESILLVAVAGVLALVGALVLITAIVSSMRRPLDALVEATGDLAAGALERRVEPSGPRELQDLGAAFNSMGGALSAAQQRIEEERRRLAVTIESLGDALIVTEPGSSVIAAANPRAADLVPELPIGGRVDVQHSPLPPLDDALRREVPVEHNGRSLAVTAAKLGSEDDGVVWTVRDMSERARLERAKSEFVAMASHELRSPLTSIKGFVELLERSPENMSERQREFVEIILRSTDRLVDLVNDLLDVARIEAGHVEINRRPIDAGEAAREVAELMVPRFRDKHQRLDVDIAPSLPLAFADPARVRQIIANILTNAHLYTPEGGHVRVVVDGDRAWARIAVADDGVGMSPEETELVFERFYRGVGGSRAATGTGLGLSIVKSLVEMLGGRIDVRSELGRGSTFTVLLPTAIVDRADRASLETVRGSRVLVVDDEREIAELIAGQLAPLEVEATIALGGQEALDRMRAERFDAVTLDILMPGMDGFEVLRRIRTDPELSAIPIVFVSVFSARGELAGEWVVSKPIDADELRDVLSAAVSAGRSRVLVVGREALRPVLEPALAEFGIEHHWELSGPAAARMCEERRFEVALIDVGIRSPQAVLQALDLRGRRLRRAVILFADDDTATPPGISRLGMEVVPVDDAVDALVAALRRERDDQPATI